VNDILLVEYGAFIGQENSLDELQLQRNDIQYFPTLTPLNKLKRLDLRYNDIETLGIQAFHAADKLTFM
jgi:Leucine-rich repeat (LRR) protein